MGAVRTPLARRAGGISRCSLWAYAAQPATPLHASSNGLSRAALAQDAQRLLPQFADIPTMARQSQRKVKECRDGPHASRVPRHASAPASRLIGFTPHVAGVVSNGSPSAFL